MPKSTADIRMLVTVEPPRYAGMGATWAKDYFHVIGRPMKMRWEDGDGQMMPYGSFYSHEGDPFYEHLRVSSQGDVNSGSIYGFEVEYYEPTGIRLYDCERMVKVLRMAERKLTKMNAELGYVGANDIAQYMARAAKALGISQFGFHPRDGGTHFANGERYRWCDAAMLDMNIADRVKDLRERAGVLVEA